MPPSFLNSNGTSPPTPAPEKRTASAWWRLWRTYTGNDPESAELRASLFNSMVLQTPHVIATTIMAAFMLAMILPAKFEPWVRWTWFTAVCVACMPAFMEWLRTRRHPPKQRGPAIVLASVLHAAVLSSLWGLLPWAAFPHGDPGAQLLIAGIMATLLAAGSLELGAMAPAGVVYALIIGTSSSLAAVGHADPLAKVMSAGLACYTVVAIIAVVSAGRRSADTFRAEQHAANQNHLVGLLLRDFEAQSSDVLWEIDANGLFGRISPKLRSLMQLEAVDTSEQTLLGWFSSHTQGEASIDAMAQLRRAFRARQAFRQRGLPVLIDGKARWWALTARPLADGAGHHQGWRGVITDITMEHDEHARALRLAATDALTGLANHVRLREHLQAALDETARRPAALLCLNMDHFKRVNDMFGHGVGDMLLRESANRLKKLVREEDFVARAGGDEFVVLLQDAVNETDLQHLGQRIVDKLAEPFTSSAGVITGGASGGIAMIPQHGQTVDELLANASLAIDAAKALGRGRCEMFRTDMGERQRLRVTLERDLRQAVARKELRLHWQPQVDSAAWRVNGFEALLRWQHPELGLIPPLQFIPLAEETGLIVELGQWVLEEACRVGVQHLQGLTVAVNVSPKQLVREDFVHVVRQTLAASGLPAGRLELEITESIFIDATPQALHNLEILRQMGVHVALDDFGTGYSSLAYLRQFPFDTLKIDRAFVRELVTQRDARAIVRSIVDLATALGMSTVAEGVETPEQYELLRRAGCTASQGFLIARPMPIDEAVETLGSWKQQRAPRSEAVPDSIFAPLAEP